MRSRRRYWWGRLVAGALVLAGPANAQDAQSAQPAAKDAPPATTVSVDLDWIAPPQCPGRPYVLHEVARLVGPAPAGARGPVKARAVIARGDDGRFRVVITTFDEEAGERAMFAPSCHALADAIALVIALRVDPTLLDRPRPPPALVAAPPPLADVAPAAQPAPVAQATPSGTLTPVDTPGTPALRPAPAGIVPSHAAAKPSGDPSPARAPAPGNQLALGASLGSSVGDLPSVSFGGEAIAGWLHGRWRVELRAATALVQRADVPGRSGVGGTVQIASGGLRGCYGLLVPGPVVPVGLAACVEGELDWMWVAGYGANPLDANAGWAAVGGGLLARWDLGRGVALRASLDALAPLARPSFVIDDAAGGTALVHRPGVAFGRAGLGVEIHFF